MNSILNRKFQTNSLLETNLPQQPPSFREFSQNISPNDAKQQVENMLNSGQISQEQFEKAKQIASLFMKNPS
jgi:hypothetical protein